MERQVDAPPECRDKIRLLLPCIRREIQRKDTAHPVFHGSWDWHSSVHGHWALLRGARILGNREDLSWTMARMGDGKMNGEFAYLMNNPSFEMPYGRAWLLRLMVTYEELGGGPHYREKIRAIARGIQAWISGSGMAAGAGEYKNPSWALVQLHAWADHAGDGAVQSWVESRVRKHHLSPLAGLEVDHEGKGEFFSRWALQAHLLSSVLGPDRLKEWLSGQEIVEENLRVVKEFNSVHHLAVNASRAWGFGAAFQATGEERWRKAFDAHITASLSLHSGWETNRYAYAHWVPQFTLYALAARHPDPADGEHGARHSASC